MVAALLATSQVTSLAAQPDTPSWVNDLNRLGQYLGRSLPADALGAIEAARASTRPEIRALSAALLYRADPVKWGSELSSTFSIHDYTQRARGEVNLIAQQEFISRIKDLESRYPTLPPTLMLLVAFVHFRDANLWFPQGDQRVSVARFFRGAFLAQAFKGSGLDPVAVASQLDDDARREFELGRKGKR
jgi:hypothetical protein